ncbi:hypothetical protein AVEN_273776-1 [Araneus ventricosus]|uniref:Uncharacterized protein n=1 Tax=Araneus ventricosus TaxID=182803 RepID=A0A4Y2P8X5_ARAVE|nr:hypothetical protein AVEN_273776-1 [Araneus ventricosus]
MTSHSENRLKCQLGYSFSEDSLTLFITDFRQLIHRNSLSLPCDRQSSTCLSRLASGHLNCLTYSEDNKIYALCPKCQQHQASPKHILDLTGRKCILLPLLVIDFIKVNGFLDLVRFRQTRLEISNNNNNI